VVVWGNFWFYAGIFVGIVEKLWKTLYILWRTIPPLRGVFEPPHTAQLERMLLLHRRFPDSNQTQLAVGLQHRPATWFRSKDF
jgi:hypothetical protein